MTLDEVKAWLAENKDKDEVKALLDALVPERPLGADAVAKWLETEDGKRFVQPLMDARVTSAINTYKTGHFDQEVKTRVAAEMLKLNPQETPAEKMAREAKAEAEAARREMETERRQRQVEKMWIEAGHKPKFVKYLASLSPEEATLFMREFSGEIDEVSKKVRNELLATSVKPGSGTGGGTKPDASKLTLDEAVKLEMEGKLNDAIAAH